MVTFLLVIIVISVLVLVHEWGHFYLARKFGVKVEEFGFGFPPKLFSKVKNGVCYSFNLFPFGGFVKIFGEHGEGEGDKESFISRPAWQRFSILAAGVAMNFLLAWFFFSVGSAIGIPRIIDGSVQKEIPVSIIGVMPGSPAEEAGLRFGDQIIEIHSVEGVSLSVETENDVQDFVEAYRGEEIILTIRRRDEFFTVAATPRLVVPEGEGPLGVMLARISVVRVPLWFAPIEGVKTLIHTTSVTVSGLVSIIRDLVIEQKTSVDIAGPVGIFFLARDTWTLGLAYFFNFVGAISLSLAILNFLPIPALDGGRILFLGIEKLRRRRIDPHLENFIHTVGFALLILLMVLVTYRDIVRLL